MRARVLRALAASFIACALPAHARPAVAQHRPTPDATRQAVENAVNAVITPVMRKYAIPGMAVGVTLDGRGYAFNYGVASLDTRKPVTGDTLFELGSVSKTFTATLAAYAQASGRLKLSDTVARHMPALRGSSFGNVRLSELATHTPGGLPLQVPAEIKTRPRLMRYFKDWQPAYPPGTTRTYSNPGIGMLGVITAASMGRDFETLLRQRVFAPLGMAHSFITVPPAERANYAQGYTAKGAPIRMSGDVLSFATYGVKSSAADMLRFVAANIDPAAASRVTVQSAVQPALQPTSHSAPHPALDPTLARAITDTHTAYFSAGPITQDLVWEQYPDPADLPTLIAGNAPATALSAMPVTAFTAPQPPRGDVLINKTGSTNGFSAYVAFVPERKIGVVILGNRNYPVEEQVRMAHQVMTALAGKPAGG